MVSEMRTLKGTGVGKDSVMGRLKKVESREELFCADADDRDAILYRTQGIAISRIEEAYEEFSKKEGFAYISKTLQEMLDALRDRELVLAINEITELGISLYDAVEHIEGEAEKNSATKELCILFKRILRAKSGIDLGDGEGCIGVVCEQLDVTEALSLRECGFLGLLFTQSAESFFGIACKSFGIPALFLNEEVFFDITSGESAILYPTRNIIYLSPKIDIVDDFTATMKSEAKRSRLKGVFKCLLGEQVYSVSEYGREGYSGLAINLAVEERSEEEVFELCRSVCEIGERELFILLRNIHGAREYLRGILRAAVYGRISILPSFASSKEYSAFCEAFSDIKGELRLEKREFESEIRQGVVLDNIFSVVLCDKIAEGVEFVLADIDSLTKNSDEKDQKEICLALLKMLCDKFLKQKKTFLLMGNTELLDEIQEDIENFKLPNTEIFFVKKM